MYTRSYIYSCMRSASCGTFNFALFVHLENGCCFGFTRKSWKCNRLSSKSNEEHEKKKPCIDDIQSIDDVIESAQDNSEDSKCHSYALRHTKESHRCLLSLSMTSIHTSHLHFHLSSRFIGMKREDEQKNRNKIQNSIWIQWITNLIDDEMRNKIPTMAINNLSIFVWIHVEPKISRVFWVYCIFISYHPFNDPTLLTTTFLSFSLSSVSIEAIIWW